MSHFWRFFFPLSMLLFFLLDYFGATGDFVVSRWRFLCFLRKFDSLTRDEFWILKKSCVICSLGKIRGNRRTAWGLLLYNLVLQSFMFFRRDQQEIERKMRTKSKNDLSPNIFNYIFHYHLGFLRLFSGQDRNAAELKSKESIKITTQFSTRIDFWAEKWR